MMRACRVCQGQLLCKVSLNLGIISTEKDTLVFYSREILTKSMELKM